MWVYLNISFSPPSLPLLFLPSLLPFTVRKGHLWRSNSVQPGTNTDGRQQQLQQWVNLQSRKSLKRYCFMCMWKVQELCNGLWEEGWRRGEGLLTRAPSGWSSLQVFNASLKALGKLFLKVRERADIWWPVQFTDAAGCRSWILLRQNWTPRMLNTLKRLEKKTLEAMHEQGPPMNCHLPALVLGVRAASLRWLQEYWSALGQEMISFIQVWGNLAATASIIWCYLRHLTRKMSPFMV